MCHISHSPWIQIVFNYSQIVDHAVEFESVVILTDEVHLWSTIESHV